MQLTAEGLDLIKRFEGFRARAYRCPSGVWTIGYGHTSTAGAPEVTSTMEISLADAETILARDAAKFAEGVTAVLTAKLSGQQFSALVSFVYNVGLGNFRKSSVLAAVNAGDLAAVPRRLQLWNRAGGKVLAGLARRRAAEAELFLSDAPEIVATSASGDVSPEPGKTLRHSSTVWAAILSALAGAIPALAPTLGFALTWPLTCLALLLLTGAAAWILRERLLKAVEEGL